MAAPILARVGPVAITPAVGLGLAIGGGLLAGTGALAGLLAALPRPSLAAAAPPAVPRTPGAVPVADAPAGAPPPAGAAVAGVTADAWGW